MEIKTARLLLRPFRFEDWEAVHAFRSDADALKFEPWGPDSVEQVKRDLLIGGNSSIRHLTGDVEWAIIEELTGRVVGGCRMKLLSPARDKRGWGMIGYVIGRQFWGMGFATEATKAMIDFAHEQKIIGVKAISDSQNFASVRVLEKCGFECVGMIAETEAVKGRFRDMLKYEIRFSRA